MVMLYIFNLDIAIADTVRIPSFLLLFSLKYNVRPAYNTNTTSMACRFWIYSEKKLLKVTIRVNNNSHKKTPSSSGIYLLAFFSLRRNPSTFMNTICVNITCYVYAIPRIWFYWRVLNHLLNLRESNISFIIFYNYWFQNKNCIREIIRSCTWEHILAKVNCGSLPSGSHLSPPQQSSPPFLHWEHIVSSMLDVYLYKRIDKLE